MLPGSKMDFGREKTCSRSEWQTGKSCAQDVPSFAYGGTKAPNSIKNIVNRFKVMMRFCCAYLDTKKAQSALTIVCLTKHTRQPRD